MKLARSVVFCFVALGTSALACGGTVEHGPQTSASAATKAPVAATAHGLVKVFGDALGEVALRPEQRTEIEKLASEAEARHAPNAQAHKDVMATLADQIEKGAIDKAALEAKIEKASAGFEKVRADDRAAFVRLHDLLDSEQRNAFVDALERQMKAKHHEGKEGHHGGPGGPGGFGLLKQLADELKLSEDQRSKIHDAVSDSMKEAHREGKHHGFGRRGGHDGKKALEAFREEKLDLDKVAPPHDGKAMAELGAERMAAFAEKVLPILTPEQRAIAASKVRQFDGPMPGH